MAAYQRSSQRADHKEQCVLTIQLNFVDYENHWGKISAGEGPDLEGEQIVSMKMLRS